MLEYEINIIGNKYIMFDSKYVIGSGTNMICMKFDDFSRMMEECIGSRIVNIGSLVSTCVIFRDYLEQSGHVFMDKYVMYCIPNSFHSTVPGRSVILKEDVVDIETYKILDKEYRNSEINRKIEEVKKDIDSFEGIYGLWLDKI